MTIIEPGMEPLKLTSVKLDLVEKYTFRFEHWGWMHVFIHELGQHGSNDYGAGELVIHSDWGAWAYTWSGIGGGKTLKEFLVEAGCDYIARKLIAKAEDEEWDPEGTKAAIRKYIEENAPDGEIELETWSRTRRVTTKAALLDYLEHCDWDSGLNLWIERMDTVLSAWLNEPWEHSVMKPTAEWTVLKEGLLPVLKAHFKSLLESKDAPQRNGLELVP
jgi:hypothetical protein